MFFTLVYFTQRFKLAIENIPLQQESSVVMTCRVEISVHARDETSGEKWGWLSVLELSRIWVHMF